MTLKSEIDRRARQLGKGGRISLRSRLKATMEVAEHYADLVNRMGKSLRETTDDLRAARYAAQWYRRRWIWTMLALTFTLIGAAVYVLGT